MNEQPDYTGKYLVRKDQLEKRYPGVSFRMEAEDMVWIDPSVFIGAGTMIDAPCQIRDYVNIGRGVRIESGCTIMPEAMIGENALIRSGTLINKKARVGEYAEISSCCNIGNGALIGSNTKIQDSCWIASGVEIGQFSTLRENTRVAPYATIKDQVEIGTSSFIGEFATIGNHVLLAYKSKVGNGAVIHDRYRSPHKPLVLPDNEHLYPLCKSYVLVSWKERGYDIKNATTKGTLIVTTWYGFVKRSTWYDSKSHNTILVKDFQGNEHSLWKKALSAVPDEERRAVMGDVARSLRKEVRKLQEEVEKAKENEQMARMME